MAVTEDRCLVPESGGDWYGARAPIHKTIPLEVLTNPVTCRTVGLVTEQLPIRPRLHWGQWRPGGNGGSVRGSGKYPTGVPCGLLRKGHVVIHYRRSCARLENRSLTNTRVRRSQRQAASDLDSVRPYVASDGPCDVGFGNAPFQQNNGCVPDSFKAPVSSWRG